MSDPEAQCGRPSAVGSHTRRIGDALPVSVRHRMSWRKHPWSQSLTAHPVPPRRPAFPGETPPRPLPILTTRSRGPAQGAGTHDRRTQVHLRQVRPRRQAPRQKIRCLGRRDVRPRPARVGISGHRSFFLRRSVRGRIRSATIGSADAMSVPEARAEARRPDWHLHRHREEGQRTQDARPPDARLRRGVPRTPRPALEAPDPGDQHLHGPQIHPPRLRTHDRGRHRRRACPRLVCLHGRPARQTPTTPCRSCPS